MGLNRKGVFRLKGFDLMYYGDNPVKGSRFFSLDAFRRVAEMCGVPDPELTNFLPHQGMLKGPDSCRSLLPTLWSVGQLRV